MSPKSTFVVRCSWDVHLNAKNLAEQVARRCAEVLGSFERDARGIPEHVTGFRVDARSKGNRGMHEIEFVGGSMLRATSIWSLGFSNHPQYEWTLHRLADEAVFDPSTIPDSI